MKTKYIKVSVSDRLPEKDGVYFSWIDNPNSEFHLVPEDYNKICRRAENGQFNSFYDVTDYLIEVPDYEEEMKEMLEECRLQLEHLNSFKERGTTNSVLSRLETLLTKLKQTT